METGNLVRIDNEVNNLTAIRLNCLVLASKEKAPARKVDLAKEYANWVLEGKIPNDKIETT